MSVFYYCLRTQVSLSRSSSRMWCTKGGKLCMLNKDARTIPFPFLFCCRPPWKSYVSPYLRLVSSCLQALICFAYCCKWFEWSICLQLSTYCCLSKNQLPTDPGGRPRQTSDAVRQNTPLVPKHEEIHGRLVVQFNSAWVTFLALPEWFYKFRKVLFRVYRTKMKWCRE